MWGEEQRSAPGTRRARGAAKGDEAEEVRKSWGRWEKSELDMGLWVAPLWLLLLICLPQAELGRVGTGEKEGKNHSTHTHTRGSHTYSHTYLHLYFPPNLTRSFLRFFGGGLSEWTACVNMPVSQDSGEVIVLGMCVQRVPVKVGSQQLNLICVRKK